MFKRWLVITICVLIISFILPGIHISGFWAAVLAGAIIGLLNLLVKWPLIILTLPINFLTLGLFTFIINGLVLYLASWLSPGFEISGFSWAVLGALIITICRWIIDLLTDD